MDSPAPVGGADVRITSSDPSIADGRTHVIVPAGQTSATFRVTAEQVGANTPETITATYGGVQQSNTITVTSPLLSAIMLSSKTVKAGDTLDDCRIYLSGNAVGDTIVTLKCDHPEATSVPSRAIILNGTNSHSLTIRTKPLTGNSLKAIITASSGDVSTQVKLTVVK